MTWPSTNPNFPKRHGSRWPRYVHTSHQVFVLVTQRIRLSGGSPNGKGNMAVIFGSSTGATTSISRVDSLRPGRASGSGGTAGPMEKVKKDKTEMRVVEKERACRIQFLLLEGR
jgi:hypothetical protein